MTDDPKRASGDRKPGVFAVPPVALVLLGEVLRHGARKYGPLNWRESDARPPTYYDACLRHLLAWRDGELIDPESGLPHLAHAMASLAIMIDLHSIRGGHGLAGPAIRALTKNGET